METKFYESEFFEDGESIGALWDDAVFRFCTFEDFESSGGNCSSEFLACTFEKLDLYWTLFNCALFFRCKFNECVFRGAAFRGCYFVECEFEKCSFELDNLGGGCGFYDSVSYGSTQRECVNLPEEIARS